MTSRFGPQDRSPAPLRTRRLASLAAVAVLCLLSACSEELPPSGTPSPVSPPSASPTYLGVPKDPLVLVTTKEDGGERDLEQVGRADATVSVSNVDGGVVELVEDAGSPALRFPPYTGDDNYPRAVVLVTNDGSDDELNPEGRPFSYGADFNLDAVSTGRSDDNGNNVIQRGISSDPSLFKLEVDKSLRPSCTVRGTNGTLTVRATVKVLAGQWYRGRCERDGDTVTISVAAVLSDGSDIPIVRHLTGPIGDVSQPEARIPISIGGKVASNGKVIVSASDQLNGLVRNPFVAIPR